MGRPETASLLPTAEAPATGPGFGTLRVPAKECRRDQVNGEGGQRPEQSQWLLFSAMSSSVSRDRPPFLSL